MITYLQFWKGPDAEDRRVTYASAFTPQLELNGTRTVDACAPLIAEYEAETGLVINRCASGWRPTAINEHTANAGPNSAHVTAEAEDVTGDTDLEMRNGYASSRFARWCAKHQARLMFRGLFMEDWHYTAKKTERRQRDGHVPMGADRRKRNLGGHWSVWCHITTRSPKSGRTMYMPFDPSTNPPQVPLFEAA